MSLQFILGSSGSGKTEYLYRQLVKEAGEHPKKNYLVIVPEQFTMQTQKRLVELSPNHAIMNIDVLSFKRLAYRVFDELGKNDVQVLEETGKNLVLRRVALEKEEALTVLRPNMNRMGYVGEMKSLISELVQYNITPEQLLSYIENSNLTPVFAAKLKDVVTMYQGFQEFLRGKYITAEEILHVLRDVAKDSAILRDSVMVFDEFTGFTPVQNTLLKELLSITEHIRISLTIDAGEDFYHSRGNEELFHLTKKTIQVLMWMAADLHIEVEEPVVLTGGEGKRFVKAPSLAFMEQNLFRSHYKRNQQKVNEITISNEKNPKEELMFAAREINRLIREEDYRYRDIAVVTGAVDTYGNYVEEIFGKYQIPFFLDTTKEVLFHPFIEFIRAALEVLSADFSYEAVFRFLRCGFCGVEEEELDILENYVLATGLRGKNAWKKRWLRLPRQDKLYDLEKLDNLRQQIYGILSPLVGVFSDKQARTSDGIFALYRMLVDLEVEEQLHKKEAEYLSQDLQAKSKEYGQIYRVVMELLEKYNHLLGEEALDIETFTEVLEAGLSAAQVAVIPPGYDSVTIGDIERTRLNHIKVLFFVGVNDGIIPKTANSGGILSEYERERMQEADMELAPGARERAFIQRFYLYRNLTKPSERLYLSYARVDSEGKTSRPSYLIGTMRKLFSALEIQEFDKLNELADFSTAEAAMDYLIHGSRDEAWFALAKWFLSNEEQKAQVQKILSAPFTCYRGEPISRAVARALYGRNLEGSVTRLEKFAECAYAHYLQYGLRLRERELAGFENVDIGNIYHAALERYSHKLFESEYDWFTVPDELRDTFAEDAMQEAVASYPSLSIYATAGNVHMTARMQEIFLQTVWALTQQVRKGRFVPEHFEITFSQADSLEALEFVLGEEEHLRLTGRIDRMDTCNEEGDVYVKVIDYKSGNTKFDLIRLYQGLQLQLVVYMNAAMELCQKEHPDKDIIPGGILYYHIDDPTLEVEGDVTQEELERKLLNELRPEGLINREERIYRAMDENLEGRSEVIPLTLKKSGEISESRSHVADTEEFACIQRYVNLQIKRLGQEIYEGDICVNPYKDKEESSCTYCPYQKVCGLDTKIPGYGYRHMEKGTKDEILDRMRTENAKGV